jgi:5-methylcytosine-specific restriction endonuclease McrA
MIAAKRQAFRIKHGTHETERKVCIVCGKEFRTFTNQDECNRCREIRPRYELVCEYCGDIFYSYMGVRFCSRKCIDAAKAKRQWQDIKNNPVKLQAERERQRRPDCRDKQRQREYHRLWAENNKEYIKLRTRDYYKRKNEELGIYPSCKIYTKICEITGELFIAHKSNARYSTEGNKIIARRKAREYHFITRSPKGSIRECSICGKTYDLLKEGSNSFCSESCRKRGKSLLRRKSKLKRKFRIKSQKAEIVNPIKVFSRDHWICQLCGVKTPKKLRGTWFDNAPELDHIIPLSKGGSHLYSNTQCLCRKCNQEKSDKLLGQLVFNI